MVTIRKFTAYVILILSIIGIYFLFRDRTGYYYNSVFLSDKIKITDMVSGKDIISFIDDENRDYIISTFTLYPKNKVNFSIQDTQIYKVDFLKGDKVLLSTLVAKVETYEDSDNLSFQPTSSDVKNILLYKYEGEEYISYTRRFYILWSENFYKLIFDTTESWQSFSNE